VLPTLAAAFLLLGQEPASGAPVVRNSAAAAKVGDAVSVRTAVTQRLTVQSIVAGTTVNEFPRETDEPRAFDVKVTAVEAGGTEAVVTYTLDPNEVDEVFEVPLDVAADRARYERHAREFQGRERHFYVLPWGRYYIWGATAGMLVNLAEILDATR
jgi:hypothetical protein